MEEEAFSLSFSPDRSLLPLNLKVSGIHEHSCCLSPPCHCDLGWVKDILGLADVTLATFCPEFYMVLG